MTEMAKQQRTVNNIVITKINFIKDNIEQLIPGSNTQHSAEHQHNPDMKLIFDYHNDNTADKYDDADNY